MRRGWRLLAVVAMAVVPGCARSGDSADKDQFTPPVYTVRVSDTGKQRCAFDPAINVLSGGIVTIRLENDSDKTREFQLFRATQGHIVDELREQLASEDATYPDWVVPAGGVGSTAPGRSNEATVMLGSSNYWYACTDQSGGGDDALRAGAGMAGELSVAGEGLAGLPSADSKFASTENGFYFDGNVAGDRTLVWVNDGQQPHHAVLLPVKTGRTFAEAKEALLSGKARSASSPFDFGKRVSLAALGPGERLVTGLHLEKRTYVLACFLPDPGTSGPPHFTRGLLVDYQVK